MTLLCPLATAFGLGIPVPGDPGPTNTLLNAWSFTDTTNWLSDHGTAPISFTNLSVSDLGAGTAVVVDNTDPAWLQYNVVENNGTTNLAFKQGSVMFWFAPNWSGTNAGGTGPGVSGRLIETGSYTEDASYGWWGLYVDPAGANLYFSGQSNDGSQATYLSAPIEWTTNRWHLIALTYSSTNSALYIDGALATNGTPVTYLPGPAAMTNGFYIGSASNGTAQAHGMFDALVTYANPLDAGTIAATYWYSFVIYDLNPMNRAYWSSAPSHITNTPTFRAISGAGYLEYVEPSSTCVTNSNVWLTNATAVAMTNDTTTVFFTTMGGDPSLLYDVFGTAQLVGNSIASAQWAWLGQCSTCGRYSITNLPGSAAYLRLGTPQDSDEDGLPDAYEVLVSHTDPQNPDTDGDGIPDWFGAVYSGVNGLDPYALCPSGDGWTILQAYQNGWDPLAFYTPPPPQNVAAVLDPTGTNATITWASGGGPVTSYEILLYSSEGQVDSNTFSFTYHCPDPTDQYIPDWTFTVRAHFTNGAYADSHPARITAARLSSSMAAIRGPGGQPYLVVGSVPPDLSSVRLYWGGYDCGVWKDVLGSTDLNAATFVNGVAPLPLDQMTAYTFPYWLRAQCIATNGNRGAVAEFRLYPQAAGEKDHSAAAAWYFVDARPHVKENLKFLLRSATASLPFSYASSLDTDDFASDDAHLSKVGSPEAYYVRAASPAGYEYYGFHVFSSNLNYSVMQELRPVRENYLWQNFVFSLQDYDQTGAGTAFYRCSELGFRTLVDPLYQYSGSSSETNPALAFTTANSQWLYFRPIQIQYCGSTAEWEAGVSTNANDNLVLSTSAQNYYGLSFNSVRLTVTNLPVLQPGTPSIFLEPPQTTYYPETAVPALQTTNYYFASQTWYLSWKYNGWPGYGSLVGPPPPLPGSPTFSVTNTSPLLITGFGQPITVAGWAKQAIENGYSDRYAYLEQYFDKAYTTDGSGNVTTNEAGLLSPYGEFFPMQPGPAALVTMADIDPPYQRGTGVVNVIKLQLDVNHDGTMDLSFAGPDNTAQVRPYVHWLNNDYDRWHDFYEPNWNQVHDQEEDDLVSAGSPGTVGVTPDCDYQWASGAYAIPSKRDLEDYTRLWIPGMKQLYEAHTNLSFELSIRNNDTADGPAINLVLAVESDGGTRYLTDTNVANDQISLPSGKCIGRISPYNTIRLNDFFQLALYPGTGAEHFIWCGVKRGKGELVLQVKQGTNLLAETSLWLDLKDIKEMYERWTVGDNGSKPPTNTAYHALEDLPVGVMAFQYGPLEATNTPYILHVHGWNMSRYDKDRYSETAFKRLYWQGYQGRFGEFRWPTKTGFTTYDASEFNAWKSGEGLYRLITNLNATYPGRVYLTAHSMGNIVAAEALRKPGTSQIVNTYIGMQAAIASHAYDPTTTNRSLGILDSFTYDRHAEYWTNGAPCYLNGVQGASHFANFFNPRDWALSWWEIDQDTKPDMGYSWVNVPNDNERYYYQSSPYTTRQLYFPEDTYEIFSFATEARCYAVGAQTNVAGPFTLSAQVDLDAAPYSFGELHKGHSGEFRSTNMDRWPFWERVLFTMGLKAAQ